MTEGGILFLGLVGLVFLSFIGTLMYGMAATSDLPPRQPPSTPHH